MTTKEKIDSLRNELRVHEHHYYVLNQPVISDKEFDVMMHELIKLEAENPQFFDPSSPTQRVGSDISNNFEQVKHIHPMLSLGNTYSEGDVADFYTRIQKLIGNDFEICCEMKFDGTSISLIYENGKLVRAVTRGDGEKGDDVTNNIKTIRSIPLELRGDDYPDSFEIRGEVLMPWTVFEELNIERAKNEEALFANPRNAASGTLKQKDPKKVAKRKLDAYLYYLISDELPTDNHYDNLKLAAKWGFKTSQISKVCQNLDEVFNYIKEWDVKRKDLPVATDGIVLKVNSIEQQEQLGYTAKSPRWAIAYKFEAEHAITRLHTVTYQVGRTGAITPVANLDPVQLSGTVVKRASLHNNDIIESLDLHIGDMVYVEKGGEIIPKITAVDKDARDENLGEKVTFITHCPDCGTTLVRYEGESAHYCPNDTNCGTQLRGKLAHYISRKAMNIDSVGPETIDLFFKNGLVRDVADLYSLQHEDIIKLQGLQETSAKNIIKGISKSKNVPYERVIFALGIRFVGATVAKKLAATFSTIDKLRNASYDELVGTPEIGDKIAQSIMAYFSNEDNMILVDRLIAVGLQFERDEEESALISEKLKDKSIVISGTFARHTRNEYKALIEKHGGKNVGSISKKTTFILAGENMGPSKLEKAQKLGIPLINEDEFLATLE